MEEPQVGSPGSGDAQAPAGQDALLKAVLDCSPSGILAFRAVRDAAGRVVDLECTLCNATAARMLGRAPSEILGGRFLVERPEYAEDGVFDRCVGVIETGRSAQFEHSQEHGGQRIWFDTSAVRLGDGLVVTFSNITARKQAEQALRDGETRYRTLFDSMDAAVLLMRGAECIACNRATIRMFGLERAEDFLGKTVLDFAPPFQPDGTPSGLLVQRYVERALTEGTQTFEWLSTRADGQPFQMEVRFTPFALDQDLIFQCVALDITDRKRAEEALRASEERFRTIFEEGPLGIATSGPDFRFTAANHAFCRMMGYDADDLARMSFRDLARPEDVADIEVGLRALMAGEVPVFHFEKQCRTGGGDLVWTATAVAALRQADGTFRSFLAMVEDISESKASEALLAAEKERLAVTLRSIADGVVTTDTDGQVVLLNRAAEELTGWSQAEAAGRPLSEVLPVVDERHRRPCADPVARVLAAGAPVDLGRGPLLVARGGAERHLAAGIAPIHDREEQLQGTVLVFRDVTEQNRMEAEAHRAQKLESVGLLAGGIAHDFNNLLTGILGSVALARLHAEAGSSQAELLTEAERAVDRAKNLTQQLLTFARGGAPIRKPTRLDDLLREATGFALRGSGARCEFDIAGDLWLADVDPGQMGQVISNLVINADEAMPEGGTVRIVARNLPPGAPGLQDLPVGRYVEIRVEDQGVGIAAEHLARIFDPYFTTKQRGSGLGLATSHAIVRKHGGQIAVESVGGRGSCFTVVLPASTGEAMPSAVPESLARGRGRILVMDDDPAIRNLCRQMLVQLGYDAESVAGGRDAIRAWAKARDEGRPYDAAIVDLTVPGGMGGRETLTHLREIDPEARVLVSSGYSNDPIMADFRSYGFCGVIAKPYDLQGLRAALFQATGV